MRRRRIWWFGLLFVILLVVVIGRLYFRPYLADLFHESPLSSTVPPKQQNLPFQVGARTLIIAPHPDDETLGGAGVIEKALAQGKQVRVVVMTSGDGYRSCVEKNFQIKNPKPPDFRRLGEARHQESVQAMESLGVPEQNVIFLGYPDGGVNGMWQVNWDYDRLHLGLNGNVRAPYSFAYEKNAPYCGANVVKNLTAILRDFQPTDVVYPDPNDQHHDHWATGAFVKYVLTEQNYRVKEWTYLVHRGDFPMPWMYKPSMPLDPPYVLTHLDTHWLYVPMNEQEEQRKMAAVQKYTTQTKVMRSFLEAFVRRNELLGTYNIPQLPAVAQTVNLADGEVKPYKLFPDAYGDTVRREMEAGADVTGVFAVLDRTEWHVGLETKAPLHPDAEYFIRIRLFTPQGVKRLDLCAQGHRLTNKILAHNSLDLPNHAELHENGNRLWVSLPSNVLAGSARLMISADTFMNHEHVDKTAWRLIQAPKAP